MADLQTSRVLLESPLVRVVDIDCRMPRGDLGLMMVSQAFWLGVPRRGVYFMERRGERRVVDPNSALMLGPDDEYRLGHPSDDGDAGTIFAVGQQLVDDALGGFKGGAGNLQPRHKLAVEILRRRLRQGSLGLLDAEDSTLRLLGSLASAFAGARADARTIGPGQRLRIERARELLASWPAEPWDLTALGRAVGCSPFHLARQFRAVTDETVSGYLRRLRLGLALDRLAQGERNLAALAVDVGFSHHSHMSARFRQAFGLTPAQARDMLTRRNLTTLKEAARS
jgi:AraC family transcriptional regulator